MTTEALTAREERCQTIERSQRAKQQAYCSAKPDGHNGDAEDSADEDNNRSSTHTLSYIVSYSQPDFQHVCSPFSSDVTLCSISSCTSSATVPVDHMLYHTVILFLITLYIFILLLYV